MDRKDMHIDKADIGPGEQTWGEVVQRCEGLKKDGKAPSKAWLQQNSAPVLHFAEICTVYKNGYVMYEVNGDHTVFWPADWKSYTYYFASGEGYGEDMIPDRMVIEPQQFMSLPWYIAASVIGEHRIGCNVLNRTGDRKKASEQCGSDSSQYSCAAWSRSFMGPEEALIRKESIMESLCRLSVKQKETYLLYYKDGLTQEEISKRLGISQQAVTDRLRAANTKMRKLNRHGCLPNEILP